MLIKSEVFDEQKKIELDEIKRSKHFFSTLIRRYSSGWCKNTFLKSFYSSCLPMTYIIKVSGIKWNILSTLFIWLNSQGHEKDENAKSSLDKRRNSIWMELWRSLFTSNDHQKFFAFQLHNSITLKPYEIRSGSSLCVWVKTLFAYEATKWKGEMEVWDDKLLTTTKAMYATCTSRGYFEERVFLIFLCADVLTKKRLWLRRDFLWTWKIVRKI